MLILVRCCYSCTENFQYVVVVAAEDVGGGGGGDGFVDIAIGYMRVVVVVVDVDDGDVLWAQRSRTQLDLMYCCYRRNCLL